MEEAPPSPKTPADSAAGSPEEPRASHHRARTRSRSSSTSPSPRSSAVPFSWEQRPGIPKDLAPVPAPAPPAAFAVEDSVSHPLLPLPPPVRSHSDLSTPRKKRSAAARSASSASADPFAAALALCARGLPDTGDDMDDLWGVPDAAAPRRPVATIADRLRLFDFYSSCKATCTVVDATVRLPRTGSLGFLSRRSGGSDHI
ncbi:hypothetical protein Cni_G19910 [Canna indica]|uniref:Uncharacterized protein n=1 Tax=Canna indica TaxID=4628 RepID=A0AAQ3KMX4_9LILI|nr:hypothetical protein Cni_G19910 [Canna indica]